MNNHDPCQGARVQVKGWCPGAIKPMAAKDGLVVRIRPLAGRLSSEQAVGIAGLARLLADPWLELTNRANLQLRGVDPRNHGRLLDGLRELRLADADACGEARRNVQVQPLWREGDVTHTLALRLGEQLTRADSHALPAKFGFAVDTGALPCMRECFADIRVERYADGVLLYADGAGQGMVCAPEEAPARALELARWFLDAGGAVAGRGRMSALLTRCRLPEAWRQVPVPQVATHLPRVGPQLSGYLVGSAFGRLPVDTLAALGQRAALRLTPWRSVLIEGASQPPSLTDLIIDPADARLRVAACTGAPACEQARGDTRSLALTLAQMVPPGRLLHVSGCPKGCAHPRAATTIVTAGEGYDFIRQGFAASPPHKRGLDRCALEQRLLKEFLHAPQL